MKAIAHWLHHPGNLTGVLLGLAPFLYLLDFIKQHAANFPRLDATGRSMSIVVGLETGTFRLFDLFTSYAGHVTAFGQSITALVALVSNWSPHTEVFLVLLIALLTFGLLMYLVWHTEPRALPFVIAPSALLFFSIQQNANWLIGYNGFAWFGTELLSLAAAMCVVLVPRRQLGVMLGMVFALAAAFTHGHGMIAWLLLLLAMLLNGRYPIYMYVVAIIGGVLTYLGYSWVVAVQVTATSIEPELSLSASGIVTSIRFALAFLGNMFTSREFHEAFAVGRLGLILAVINLAILAVIDRDWRFFRVWLPVAGYSVLTALLVGLSRQNAPIEGIDSALRAWYITATSFFWIGLIVSGVVIGVRWHNRPSWWRTGIVGVNLLVAIHLLRLFVPGNAVSLNREIEQVRFLLDSCHLEAMYTADVQASNDNERCRVWSTDGINTVSHYELGLFADYEPQMMLPEQYTPDTPVVVEGLSGWANYNTLKWLLAEVDEQDVIHVTPDQPQNTYVDVRLTPILNGDNAYEHLLERLGDTNSLWYVRWAGLETQIPEAWTTLSDQGFVATSFTYERDNVTFLITRYQKLELQTDTPARFGDHIRMIGWTSLSDRLAACSTVTVRSLWETDALLLDGFSATLTLDRITGDGVWDYETVARTDSQLTLTPSNAWIEGERYLDERTLDIPCDLAAGDYALQIGVYNYRDGVRLIPTVEGETDPSSSDIQRMETVTVEGAE